jgi:hypothetical protein
VELSLRDVGGTGGGFPGMEIDEEGRGAGLGGGLFSAAIDGSTFAGEDSAACGLGLNPFTFGIAGADIAGTGGGLGAEFDGGRRFVILLDDSGSE